MFFRPKKNGISFIEGMPIGSPGEGYPKPGMEEPEKWKPYKLWVGDLWVCKGCGAEIIVGTGLNPISEHYKPEFVGKCALYGPTIQINDC